MRKGLIELPTTKKTYISYGLILIVFIGLLLYYQTNTHESYVLISVMSIGYLLSIINAPITKAKTLPPKLGEDYKKFIKKRYGSIRKRNRDSKVIESNINLNLGFLVFVFYAIYLLTTTPPMEFVLLFSLTTAIYMYLSGIESAIGIITPIYPVFLVLPASIFLNTSSANLFFSSAILGLLVSSIFAIREIKQKRLITVNIGGRGNFEAYFIIGLLTLLFFF